MDADETEPLPRNPRAAQIALGSIGLAAVLLAWLLFRPAPMAAATAESTAPPEQREQAGSATGAEAHPRMSSGAAGNHPPKAVVRMRQDPHDPSSVEYSALFSEDDDAGDEDHLTFAWDFGDGTTANDSQGVHQFAQPGTFAMVLTVTDPKGGVATDKARVVVPSVNGPTLAGVAPSDQAPGLRCQRIVGRVANFAAFNTALPGADSIIAHDVSLDQRPANNDYGMRFTGFIAVPKPGIWHFFITSDDGSRLSLGGVQVAIMDRMQPPTQAAATVNCTAAGLIPIVVDYYQGGSSAELRFEWSGPDQRRQPVPAGAFFHAP